MQNGCPSVREVLRRWGSACLVLFVSLFSTAVFYFLLKGHVESRGHKRFQEASQAAFKSAELHLDYHLEVLKSVRALFFANERLSREDWKKYFRTFNLFESHPGLIDVGYTLRVPRSAKEAHVASVKRQDSADYFLHPEGDREEYFPLIYLEDLVAGDPGPVGWDVFSDADRRPAMERARDTGQASSTGKILVGVARRSREYGFIVYLPIYRGGVTPSTMEARRAALQGFVFASLRPAKLWKGASSLGQEPMVNLEIFDGTELAEAHLLYGDDGVFHATVSSNYSGQIRGDALGRSWTFRFSALPVFAANLRTDLPVIVLVAGLLVSVLLFGIACMQARARVASEQLAAHLRRSEEILRQTNERLEREIAETGRTKEALRESETRLRSLIGSIDEIVFEFDADGTFHNVWTSNEELLAVPKSELVGRRAEDFFGRDFTQRFMDAFRRVLDSGQPESIECALEVKAGKRWFLARISPISSGQGRRNTVCMLARDITARKAAEEALTQNQVRLKLLNSILACMASASGLGETLVRMVRRIQEFFPDLQAIYSVIDSAGLLTVVCSAEPPGWPSLTGRAIDLSLAPKFLTALQEREPLVVENVASDLLARPLTPSLADQGIQAILALPVKQSSDELGLLCLSAAAPRPWSEHEIVTLQELAEHLFMAFQHDDTGRKRREAERLLAREKELLSVTLRSAAEGIVTTDRDGRIRLLNQVAENLTGWKLEALGRPIMDVFHLVDEKSRDRIENPVEKVLRTGEIFELSNETLLLARDETECAVAGRVAPIFDVDGKINGAVVVFQDVTEKRKIEVEMLKASRIESLGLLAGGIAHDFNNILTGILGNVSLARMFAPPDAEVQKRLELAEKACLRARDLTQQLLAFAKGGNLLKRAASLVDLINEAADLALRGSNVRSEIQHAPDLWPVDLDPAQIKQVINHLILNAAESMPEGGLVKVRTENLSLSHPSPLPLPAGDYVKMILEDQGIGIQPEHLAKIFDPYFSATPPSSGLGLATAYLIIKKHGGLIQVESELGVGTRFDVYLPSSRAGSNAKQTVLQPSPGAGKILVMDDDPAVRELALTALSRLGYEVELVKDGAETVRRYSDAMKTEHPFAAVLLDLTVPGGMGAKEAVKQLLAIDPNVKAIVSSGYSLDSVMANFREHGFSGCVSKPYRLEELAKALRQVVRQDAG